MSIMTEAPTAGTTAGATLRLTCNREVVRVDVVEVDVDSDAFLTFLRDEYGDDATLDQATAADVRGFVGETGMPLNIATGEDRDEPDAWSELEILNLADLEPAEDAPETLKVTGKAIAEFYARCTPGARLECLDNTYRAAAIGIIGTVTRADGSTISMDLSDGTTGAILIPRRVRDVKALTADTITTALIRKDGTATWRILPTEDDHRPARTSR